MSQTIINILDASLPVGVAPVQPITAGARLTLTKVDDPLFGIRLASARKLFFHAVGNPGGLERSFVVVGMQNNVNITEKVIVPNNTDVASANYYDSVLSITSVNSFVQPLSSIEVTAPVNNANANTNNISYLPSIRPNTEAATVMRNYGLQLIIRNASVIVYSSLLDVSTINSTYDQLVSDGTLIDYITGENPPTVIPGNKMLQTNKVFKSLVVKVTATGLNNAYVKAIFVQV